MESDAADFPYLRKAWEHPRVIPTGFRNLDIALGMGGIPSGNIVEVSGPISSGKSTLCQRIIAESQKLGGWCAFIDADQAWEAGFARRCGVDVSRLLVCNMFDLSSALESLSILVKSGALSLIVLDSISPFHPLTVQLNQPVVGPESLEELVSRTLRQISQAITLFQSVVVITCLALPHKQPIYHGLSLQTSRMALKMHASIRIRLSTINEEKNLVNPGGLIVRAKIIKNSFYPCQQFVDLDIM